MGTILGTKLAIPTIRTWASHRLPSRGVWCLGCVAPVADAVGERIEVICDGGVRRGSDILNALAAGVTAAMDGRSFLSALGAAGDQGVDRVPEWFHVDLVRTMSLVGAATIADLDRTLLDLTTAPEARS